MNICPNCGQPKEVHEKAPGTSSKRLPKQPAGQIRICPLELVDLVGEDEDIPLRRADRELVASRLAAYREERELRFT